MTDMNRSRTAILLTVLAGLLALARGTSEQSAQDRQPRLLRRITAIELPGPQGQRFDYLTLDAASGLLYATHLGAGRLYIVDVKTNQVRHTISDLPGIEGVEVVPEAHKAYTSDWYEDKIAVIDLQSWSVIKKIPTASKPDGIAYAAPFHKIYVSDERGRAEAVVDVNTDTITKTLHFSSETGNPRYDPVSKRVLVNLQDTHSIAVIDPASDTVEGEVRLQQCRGNHGMALDPEHRLAFLVCEDNDRMTVVGLDTRKESVSFPLPSGADVIAFDPVMRRIYVPCYSGAMAIFEERDPQQVVPVGTVTMQRKVHSLAIDSHAHRLYVPEQEVDGRPASRLAIYEAVP
jgi:DNA-binding beta-propeller fold protein YncE